MSLYSEAFENRYIYNNFIYTYVYLIGIAYGIIRGYSVYFHVLTLSNKSKTFFSDSLKFCLGIVFHTNSTRNARVITKYTSARNLI